MPEIHDTVEVERQEALGIDICSSCRRPSRTFGHIYIRENIGDMPTVLCEQCFNRQTVQCAECHTQMSVNSGRQVSSDLFVCNTCFRQSYTNCRGCHEAVRRSEMSTLHTRYCQRCAEAFHSCPMCDSLVMSTHTENDTQMCNNCWETGGRFIKEWNFRPMQTFYRTGNDSEPIDYFGVENELECLSYDRREQDAGTISELVNGIDPELKNGFNTKYCYMKRDGSLHQGFEIVTRPMSLKYHQTFDKWKELYNKVDNFMEVRSTCGLHVHISREHVDELLELKMVRFFEFNQYQIRMISRREGNWSYCCNYGSTFRDEEELRHAKGNRERYRSLNFNNEHTIECRIFRGTTNYNEYIASIEFCSAMLSFVRGESIASTNKPNWFKFAEWLEGKKETYPCLWEEVLCLKIDCNGCHSRLVNNVINGGTYKGIFKDDGEVAWNNNISPHIESSRSSGMTWEVDWTLPCELNCTDNCEGCMCQNCEENCEDCESHPNYDRNNE